MTFFAIFSFWSRFSFQMHFFQKKLKKILKVFQITPLIKVTLRELLGFPRRRKPETSENQLEKSPWQ